MNPEHLYARILQGHRANVRFTDFQRLLEAFGFHYKRSRGSHQSFEHYGKQVTITVQPDQNGNAKGYQIKQFLDLVRKHSLRMGA